jgi:DNA repair protein RadA/Sms
VLAVLEAHCGVRLGGHDVYLNVAGGLRIQEPAADLAVAAALVSSLTGAALSAESVFFGEVSLSGSVRPVAHAVARMKEAAKLGFRRAVGPVPASESAADGTLIVDGVASLATLVANIAAVGESQRRGSALQARDSATLLSNG